MKLMKPRTPNTMAQDSAPPTKKTAAKKTPARKTTAKKTTARKATAKKTAPRKTTARKAAPRKAVAKKTPVSARPAARPARTPVPASVREPGAGAAALSPAERRIRIAEAAYYRAERRGFVPGHEMEDWLAAEAEVDLWIKRGTP